MTLAELLSWLETQAENGEDMDQEIVLVDGEGRYFGFFSVGEPIPRQFEITELDPRSVCPRTLDHIPLEEKE